MDIEFKFDGSDFEKAVKEYPKDLVTQLRKGSKKSASLVQDYARQNHRFETRSGKLVKSIRGYGSARLGRGEDIAMVRLVLHGEDTTLGTEYGKYIHEGFKHWRDNSPSKKTWES